MPSPQDGRDSGLPSLRELCRLHGLDLPTRRAVIRLVGVVSPGASCRATGRSGGFDYVELFKESEGG